MATLEYVEVPAYATRLQAKRPTPGPLKPEPKIVTSLPQPPPDSPSSSAPLSPSKLVFSNIPAMLLSSTLQIPSNPVVDARGGGVKLMSTKDPLSIPIMTVNFKRFTSKVGPVYWMQDRIEEILTWKKGWKVTAVWMSAYAFLCFFPRLVLLVPHAILIGIMLHAHPLLRHGEVGTIPLNDAAQAGEGSVDWQANLQATQNLLGVVSDLHDAILPVLPHLTYSSPYSSVILSFALASFALLLPVVYLIPLRPLFLIAGLFPFFLTHPFTQSTLIPLFRSFVVRPCRKTLQLHLTRLIDDDKMEDKHWRAEVQEVDLWENERWTPNAKESSESIDAGTPASGSWGKLKLKPGERKAWTRGRDGWSGISDNGGGDVSSNLTFSLESGWSFVETEDWRPDLDGTWISVGADDNGWVYTNDAWLDPKPVPSDEWLTPNSGRGMTRRRRWIRRIYYAGEAVTASRGVHSRSSSV